MDAIATIEEVTEIRDRAKKLQTILTELENILEIAFKKIEKLETENAELLKYKIAAIREFEKLKDPT